MCLTPAISLPVQSYFSRFVETNELACLQTSNAFCLFHDLNYSCRGPVQELTGPWTDLDRTLVQSKKGPVHTGPTAVRSWVQHFEEICGPHWTGPDQVRTWTANFIL